MRTLSQLSLVIGLTLCVVDVQPLHAEPIVVYSTLASDGTYNANQLWVIETFGFEMEIAAGFSPSVTSRLASIRLPLRSIAPLFGTSAQVSLMSDIEGAPGAPLEDFTLAPLLEGDASDNALVGASSVRNPLLVPGRNYWLVASMPTGTAGWNTSKLPGATILQRITNQDWVELSPGAAFDVVATPVPEPASLTLVALGLAGLGALWQGRRKV